jgi:hypothetical protein
MQCYMHCKERGGERSEPVTPPHSPTGGAHAECTFEGMCAAKTERMNPHPQSDKLLASGQEVRSTRRVGAPSDRCPEWAHQHLAGASNWVHRRGRVMPRSKQPRRCQAAEESRRPGAHTPGGKNTPFWVCVLRRQTGVTVFRALLSNAVLVLWTRVNASFNQ